MQRLTTISQARSKSATELKRSKCHPTRVLNADCLRMNWIFITARNNHIKNLAKKDMREIFHDRLVSVFCVSNKAYNKIRNPQEQELALEGSGIPDLRLHCHRIPARAQFRLAEHFVVARIPDLLRQGKMWYSAASEAFQLDDEVALHALMDRVEQELSKVY